MAKTLGPALEFKTLGTALTALTHSVGTADGTVDDVGGSFNQTTLNNNFKELTTHINAIIVALKGAGVMST